MVNKKIIISGGGTGGHIFPAISIANAIKENYPDSEILFVGAEGKIEMEKVPDAGYKIIGLPIAGFVRKFSTQNIKVVMKLIKSLLLSRKIIKDFNPDVVVGVGGYASGPVLYMASRQKIPTLIQRLTNPHKIPVNKAFPTTKTSYYNMGSAQNQTISSWRADKTLISFFGRASYNFKQKVPRHALESGPCQKAFFSRNPASTAS